MAETFYSVEEANALVPKLKTLLERVRATQAALAADKSVAVVREKAAHNGGGLPGPHLSELHKTLERDLRQLQEVRGVLLERDGKDEQRHREVVHADELDRCGIAY